MFNSRAVETITLDGARRVKEQGLAQAAALGLSIALAVIDRTGILVLAETMDDAPPGALMLTPKRLAVSVGLRCMPDSFYRLARCAGRPQGTAQAPFPGPVSIIRISNIMGNYAAIVYLT